MSAAILAALALFFAWRARQGGEPLPSAPPTAHPAAAAAPTAPPDPFQLPRGLTPNAEQQKQLGQIRFRYGPILAKLAADLAAVNGSHGDPEAERRFFGEKIAETKGEISRAIESILTDEQKKK